MVNSPYDVNEPNNLNFDIYKSTNSDPKMQELQNKIPQMQLETLQTNSMALMTKTMNLLLNKWGDLRLPNHKDETLVKFINEDISHVQSELGEPHRNMTNIMQAMHKAQHRIDDILKQWDQVQKQTSASKKELININNTLRFALDNLSGYITIYRKCCEPCPNVTALQEQYDQLVLNNNDLNNNSYQYRDDSYDTADDLVYDKDSNVIDIDDNDLYVQPLSKKAFQKEPPQNDTSHAPSSHP